MIHSFAEFVKQQRKNTNLTQEELAQCAGVALTVIRKIEQGKDNLRLAKVNQVLLHVWPYHSTCKYIRAMRQALIKYDDVTSGVSTM